MKKMLLKCYLTHNPLRPSDKACVAQIRSLNGPAILLQTSTENVYVPNLSYAAYENPFAVHGFLCVKVVVQSEKEATVLLPNRPLNENETEFIIVNRRDISDCLSEDNVKSKIIFRRK
jgi:hypothetical protein